MKFHPRPGLLGLLALVSVLSGACDDLADDLVRDNTPVCTPAELRACYCNDGARGAQACASDGTGFGACDCSPDAGSFDATVDSGVDPDDADAPLDVPTDAPAD